MKIIAVGGMINGVHFISVPGLTIEKQIRTHRKRRINKKWRKRFGVLVQPDPSIYKANGVVYGHPDILAQIEQALNSGKGE